MWFMKNNIEFRWMWWEHRIIIIIIGNSRKDKAEGRGGIERKTQRKGGFAKVIQQHVSSWIRKIFFMYCTCKFDIFGFFLFSFLQLLTAAPMLCSFHPKQRRICKKKHLVFVLCDFATNREWLMFVVVLALYYREQGQHGSPGATVAASQRKSLLTRVSTHKR